MRPGSVAIVGAGPGDPALLTVRARTRLESADLVLHDSLVGAGIIDLIPESTTVENVGKDPNGDRTSQREINRRMLAATDHAQRVVRLKGGDPTVFGRGGEEAEFLAAEGVLFEFVPGISSAVAGPTAGGIPLTHRDHASSVTIVTGHEDPTKADSSLDWAALARTVSTGGTLVVLMGVSRLPDTVSALRHHGLGPETPIAMVERATLPGETVVTGTLTEIVDAAEAAAIQPPAVTVVGDVVSIGEALAGAAEAVPGHGDTRSGATLEADGGVASGGKLARGRDR